MKIFIEKEKNRRSNESICVWVRENEFVEQNSEAQIEREMNKQQHQQREREKKQNRNDVR